MSRKQRISAGLGLGASLLCCNPLFAGPVGPDRNFGMEVKVTAQSEDDRDLDTRSGGDAEGIALDLRPWVYGQRGNWGAMVMLQAVAATDIIETDPTDPNEEPGAIPRTASAATAAATRTRATSPCANSGSTTPASPPTPASTCASAASAYAA